MSTTTNNEGGSVMTPEPINTETLASMGGNADTLTEAGQDLCPKDDGVVWETFPHPKIKTDEKTGYEKVAGLKKTTDNLKHLLDSYGIECTYDVYTKKPDLKVPWLPETVHGWNDTAVTIIESQCAITGMPFEGLDKSVAAICYQNPIYPVRDWLQGLALPGDGVNYIQLLANTINVVEVDQHARDLSVWLFMVQCCAAADMAMQTPNEDAIARYEHVLLFQSGQGVKKTKWFRQLVPAHLRKTYFVDGVTLDPSSKDSLMEATGAWIIELGEIEATFTKKALTILKSFLSKVRDQFRVPYGRSVCDWPRATSYCGSGNEVAILKDKTGNRRFWMIRALSLTLPETAGIDISKVWAQAWAAYMSGAQWWPTDEQEAVLEAARKDSEQSPDSAMWDKVLEAFGDLSVERKRVSGRHWKAGEILSYISYTGNATDKDTKDLAALMMRFNLDENGLPDFSERSGSRSWRMPHPVKNGPTYLTVVG